MILRNGAQCKYAMKHCEENANGGEQPVCCGENYLLNFSKNAAS